ncbi:60S ribosomal protein L6-2 [Striga hermonthica]|uniref:60S ribosomal protein L6-2 n=1 Tax=Striga hermonthica TaxID=68872 RepID=A0A9N7MPU3_STRHE|nr:60S ribosomal protein L6-2 [Striga hermonthica]
MADESKAEIPAKHDLNEKWDDCLDLVLRRFSCSSIAGGFTGILFFRECLYLHILNPLSASLVVIILAYVIGTSTKVDISGVNVDKFDDKYFAKQNEKKKKKGETEFFEADKQEKNELPAEKKEDQKAVDAPLLKAVEVVPDLKTYLGARFSLKSGMKPHELVF